MSIPKINYSFKPGRLMKSGRTNISKDKSVFNYVCNERLTLGVKFKDKAVVTNCDIPGAYPF